MKANKLILSLFICIFLINLVNAIHLEPNESIGTWTKSNNHLLSGWEIKVNSDITLTKVGTLLTQTEVLIKNSSSGLILNQNSTTNQLNEFNFNFTLYAGNTYEIITNGTTNTFLSQNATKYYGDYSFPRNYSEVTINRTRDNAGNLVLGTQLYDIAFLEYNLFLNTDINVTLDYPTNNTVLPTGTSNFNATYTSQGVNFKNATYYIWNSTGGIFNQTFINITGNSINTSSIGFNSFILGLYSWNVYLCTSNANACTWANQNYSFYYGATINSESYNPTALEQTSQTFTLNITYDSSAYTPTGILTYNHTQYSGTISGTGNNILISRTITTPDVSTAINIPFYWTIGLTSTTTNYYNSTFHNQTVSPISLDNCASNTVLLYNFTMRDEESKTFLNGTTNNTDIQIDLRLSPTSSSTINPLITFSNTYTQINPAQICSNVNLTDSYRADLIASYVGTNYVTEFYYIDNETINNLTIPINTGLYSLPIVDSTSFLFNFKDEDGVEPPNVIIHTLRKYIGSGIFTEVERSKQDTNGQTLVHLVEEDVIYKFNVTLNGHPLFLSDEYTAKCLQTPCSITLDAQLTAITFTPEDEWDNLPTGTYQLTSNRTTRDITLLFNLNESALINLTIYQYNGTDETAVTTGSLEAIAGAINLNVPFTYKNNSYFAVIYYNNELINSQWIDLSESGKDYFSVTGLFISFLAVLALILMGISQGEFVFIWALLGVITTMLLKWTDLDWFALMTITTLICIFIYKLAKRRRVQ